MCRSPRQAMQKDAFLSFSFSPAIPIADWRRGLFLKETDD
jgi:hypothetical protein